MFPFGKDFKYPFHPEVDGEPVELPASTAPVSIYVYSSKPTRANAASGSGSPIQTITPNTWVETDGYSRLITVAAINDPDPTAESLTETYWIAINYRLQADAQIQTTIRRLELQRPTAHHLNINVTINDLKDIFPKITSYSTEADVKRNIETALILIKAELNSKGFRWSAVYRPDQLSLAGRYKALCLFAQGQRGDEFKEKYDLWVEEYRTLISSLRFEYDEDEDGQKDVVVTTPSYWLLSR